MCFQVLSRKSQTSSNQQEREDVFIHSCTTFPLKAGRIWSQPEHKCLKLVPYGSYRWAKIGHPHHPLWNATSLIDWCTSRSIFVCTYISPTVTSVLLSTVRVEPKVKRLHRSMAAEQTGHVYFYFNLSEKWKLSLKVSPNFVISWTDLRQERPPFPDV